MRKIVKQYWWAFLMLFLAIIIIPVILQWMMVSVLNNTSGGSNDGWLGFWGGYLGAIISTLGVYITLRKQLRSDKKNLQEQLYNDRENNYKIARPFFIVGFAASHMIAKTYLSKYVGSISCVKRFICINNVSSKNMYAVKILVANANQIKFKTYFKYFAVLENNELQFYKKGKKSYFVANNLKANYDNAISIDKIGAGQKVYLGFSEKNISSIWIWYTTELRESIKLYFSIDEDGERIIYQKEDHLLENKLAIENPKKHVSDYSVVDFEQSKKL